LSMTNLQTRSQWLGLKVVVVAQLITHEDGNRWRMEGIYGTLARFFFLKIRIQNNFCGMQLTENTSPHAFQYSHPCVHSA
jgi:hypothetical protein